MKRRTLPGAAPGTISVDPAAPQPVMHVIAFGPQGIVEKDIALPDDVREHLTHWPVCWLNVDGLGNEKTLSRLAEIFGLHPLAMEDVVNVHQRAKVEEYGDRLFIVTHMPELKDHLDTEQLSIFVGKNFVLTFQERPGWDCLEPVRERLRNPASRIRHEAADYLAYALLDAVVDQYFPVLEVYGERVEALEEQVLIRPDRGAVAAIHDVKRDLLHLRRAIWPQREAFNTLLRDPVPHVTDATRIYLRDCYDHTVRIIDLVETYREVCSDLMDLYLSSISQRMNEIMKVLTVISTLFIPLTFVVGIYGMNFNPAASPWNMPEINWYWGYPACLAVMAAITVGQLFFFRRKGWIGSRDAKLD